MTPVPTFWIRRCPDRSLSPLKASSEKITMLALLNCVSIRSCVPASSRSPPEPWHDDQLDCDTDRVRGIGRQLRRVICQYISNRAAEFAEWRDLLVARPRGRAGQTDTGSHSSDSTFPAYDRHFLRLVARKSVRVKGTAYVRRQAAKCWMRAVLSSSRCADRCCAASSTSRRTADIAMRS